MNDKKVREFLKVAELWHAGKSVKEIVPLSGVPERTSISLDSRYEGAELMASKSMKMRRP